MSDFTKKRLEKSKKLSWRRPIPQISDEELIANLIWSKIWASAKTVTATVREF